MKSAEERELQALWSAHHRPLLGWLRAVEPAVADDLESDVWVDAIRALKSFTGDQAGFRAWLFTIARRRLIDYRRRQMRRPDYCTNLVPESVANDAGVSHDQSNATVHAIATIAKVLSPEHCDVVLLRIVAGLSANEVAALLGKTPESVRVMQHRALNKLARSLERADFGLEESCNTSNASLIERA